MLYREIIAVCSEIHTKQINTLYGQEAGILNFKPIGSWRNVRASKAQFVTSVTVLTVLRVFLLLSLDAVEQGIVLTSICHKAYKSYIATFCRE